MSSRRRSLAGTAALAAGAMLAAGCGSSPTSSTTNRGATRAPAPRAVAATGACTARQLATVYAGTQGATGHLELTLAVRNISGRHCRIRGYPGARLLDRRGRALPLRVRDGHGFFPDTLAPPRTVVLAPGSRAHFGISFPTNREYAGAHVCRTAAAVLTAAPVRAVRRWSRVALRGGPKISPCGPALVVSPVHA